MRQWINAERTVLVRQFKDGGPMEVATRPDPWAIWSPPITLEPDPTVDNSDAT